ERVMHRVTENTSYGANSIRDGVGISPREEKEPVYLPTDIMNFPKLQGVIRLSNARAGRAFPIAPISFTWADLPAIADPFIKRQGPDPVRAFLGITPRAPTGGPSPEPAPAPAAGGAALQLVVNNDNDGASDAAQQELPLDITEQPTQQGVEAAAREAAEQERVRLEQQQRQLNEGTDTPNRPDDPAGEMAVQNDKPTLDLTDYMEIH
ncbi:type IV secretion system DNA-binding domain-containing protein, partial [Brevundimonas sp.]|uniref:type IV secretion system DNA-binding domain-containing protein n=1 Tax=Brevundimonas sp. TaxID=1871086 RepID=UPI0027EEE8CE